MKDFVRELFFTIGLAILIFIVLQATVLSAIVDGSSMEPGLKNGQRLIVLKVIYLFKAPERGDIVIIHPPFEPETRWVKRIIGLPGDVIEVKNGSVYINGIELEEPYIKSPPEYTMRPFKVPEGAYFVLGDNRNNSTDSHLGWTVPRRNIEGEVLLRIWPFNVLGIIHGYPLSQELERSSTALFQEFRGFAY